MHFDWNINVGNVLTALVMLGGFIGAHIQNVKNLQEIKTKVGMMYKWFEHHVIHGGDE